MKLKKISSFVATGLIIVAMAALLSGCKCRIKEDQLARLAELRSQERTLNSELTAQQNAKTRLEAELRTRTTELNDCNSIIEIVKQRLSVWPNIWPDYTPQP